MKPHTEYKFFSGLTACQIPRHWGSSKIKYLAEIQTGTTPSIAKEDAFQEEGGLPWFTPDDLDETGEPSRASKFLTIQGEKEVKPIAANSTLICCIGSIGKTGFTNEKASSNQQINAVTFHESKKFGFYSILNCKEAMECMATGNVLRILNSTRLGGIEIPVPPRIEREQITQYLDRETGKIDALIAEQQRLIELLQEKRQAVISHAVTKGLNPDAPMKESGVEWLGEVPGHWVGCRFKHCLIGLTDAEHKTCPDYEEGEYLIIRTSNIREGVLITEGAKYTDANGYKEWTTRCTPQEGDIVFTREAPAGEACIIPEGVTACLGQRTVLMHPRCSKVTPEYLVSSIYSGAAKTFIQNLSQGSTVAHLNMSEIGNMPIALPPLDEQLEINKYTRDKSQKFDDLMKQARTSTKLLQERRSALISAAVTGQIDVRGFATAEEVAA